MADTIDLATLDRDVAKAALRVEKATKDLLTEEGRALQKQGDPFGELRHVSTQTTFRALREQSFAAHEAIHRDALVRWVHELLQIRVGWDLRVAAAEAEHAADPTLARRVTEKESAELLKTWREAHVALLHATALEPTKLALERLAALAAPIAAIGKEARERRLEVAKRLELEHPWSLATTKPVTELARALLEATDPLAKELARDREKRGTHLVRDAFAPDAREGWPAKLGARFFEDAFSALVVRPFAPPAFPAALGGASFLRGAAAWGFALRLAGTAKSLPFALARDPYPDDAHRFGCTLAFALASRPFAKRALGLTARAADAHARALGRSLFLTLRLSLLRVLADVMEWEELGARVFGTPLPGVLRDAWPPVHADEPARFTAMMSAHLLATELEQRFDDDWFKNPKAGVALAALASGPVWRGEVIDLEFVTGIARSWEEALG